MTNDSSSDRVLASERDEFARVADQRSGSFLQEFWEFARHNKKWWMTPIFVIVVLVGALVLLGGSGGGSFVYSLF